MGRLKNYLLAGLAVILPLAVTIWVLVGVFRFIDGLAGKIIVYLTGHYIPGLGFVITIALIFLAGLLATNIIGRRLLELGESILLKIPLARTIYRLAKQVTEAVSRKDEQVFRQVVLVEWPRRGVHSVGFLIGEAGEDLFGAGGGDKVKVFIPTVPNPTTGFLFIAPRDEVWPMPMSVEDGLKFILSVGIVSPGEGGNNGNAHSRTINNNNK